MSNEVLVDVDDLRHMLCRIRELDILEANGVNNWCGYSDDQSGMMGGEDYEDYLHTLSPEQLIQEIN